MSEASAKRQRAARLERAIERLARLVENGELLAATDPATLLDAVCSRVDEAERAREAATEHARRQDAELAQVRRAYLHEMAEREAIAQRVSELEAEAVVLRKRNAHLETTVTASLGEQVAKVASLERELALARAAIPETVVCTGCQLEVTTRSLVPDRYHAAGNGICGEWRKGGKPWDCWAAADVIDQTTEVGE